MYYYKVKDFLKNKVHFPKEAENLFPREKLSYYKKNYKTEIRKSINNANVIVVDLNKYPKLDVTNVDVNKLKDCKLPFNNFFIELVQDNKNMGIHVIQKVKNEIEIFNYVGYEDGTILPLMIIVDLEMLPRFYVGCVNNKCERYVSTQRIGSLLGKHMCMRTPRTAEFCPQGIMGRITIELVLLIIQELNRKPKYTVEDKTTLLSSPTTLVKKQYKKKQNQQFIYLNKEIKVSDNDGGGERKGTPKRPHTRRGHYRHYKNGKVVWVKPTRVKEGKNNQKFYKL